MLHLKQKYHLKFPSYRALSLQLSPVVSDNDELIQEIESRDERHDDNWQLSPVPDAVELESFWSNVQDDIHNDPTWHRFDDE